MGGDGSPKKIIDGIAHHFDKNRNSFYQIFGDKNKINKLNYNIEKLAMFSGSLKEKLKTSNHITFHISKPIFSLDKKKAIIFSSNSHEPKIYLFLKMDNPNAELGAWKLHKVYNSLFSNLNY